MFLWTHIWIVGPGRVRYETLDWIIAIIRTTLKLVVFRCGYVEIPQEYSIEIGRLLLLNTGTYRISINSNYGFAGYQAELSGFILSGIRRRPNMKAGFPVSQNMLSQIIKIAGYPAAFRLSRYPAILVSVSVHPVFQLRPKPQAV